MDRSPLPQTDCPGILDLLQGYFEWSHSQARPLAERERRLKQFSAAICELLLVQDARFDDKHLRPGPCDCGGTYASKGLRSRTLVTTVGEVTVHRRYYSCDRCTAHPIPVDQAWGIERGCLSPTAKAEVVDLATALPYREAQQNLDRTGRLRVSLSTIWRAAQQAGAAVVKARQRELEEGRTRSGAAKFLQVMQEVGSVCRATLAVDGLFIRICREWREVKIAVIGERDEAGEWIKGRTTYLASAEPAETFRRLLVRQACSWGITRRSPVVILSDGAEWIATLPKRFYPKARHIVDYWHAKQYLWKAAHLLFGEGTSKAAAFVEELKPLLWNGEVQRLAERFEAERERRNLTDPKGVAALKKAGQYLVKRADLLQYATYQEEGLPIGSGAAESGCKTLVQSRMKRSGMNWSPAGAENMLALRADYCARVAVNS